MLSFALCLRAQGKLISAASLALSAGERFQAAFFEGHALAAAIAGEMGEIPAALKLWEKIVISAPHKLQWLEAAIFFALQKPQAAECLARWAAMLDYIYLDAPSPALLTALWKQDFTPCGAAGIHAGRLKGWVWLQNGQKLIVDGNYPKNFSLALKRGQTADGHSLYKFDEKLPDYARVFRLELKLDNGRHLGGSPLIYSPPQAVRFVKKEKAQPAVLIPAYGDAKATLACIGSCLASFRKNTTKVRLAVAWDRGPDVKLLAALRRLAERGKIELIENPVNMGFLASVNNAIAHMGGGDIILLNADTLVHGSWIDRLAQAARAPAAATVTAIGNEAELLSWPDFRDRGKVEDLRQLAILDNAAATLAPEEAVVEIPVGVGFCMYITRAALNAIGGFDGRSIFRGYSEEVDFCLRAREAGFKNYGAFNVFVAHLGERSFGAGKKALAAQNNVAVFDRFKGYRADYDNFVQSSLPRKLRDRIALAALPRTPPLPELQIRPWALRFLPPWARDEKCPPDRHGAALFLRPGPGACALLRIWTYFPTRELMFYLPADEHLLKEALAALTFAKTTAHTLTGETVKLARAMGLSWIDRQAEAAAARSMAAAATVADIGVLANVMAAPPASLGALRRLKRLALQLKNTFFHAIHIETLWPGAPLPGNIADMPLLGDYRLVKPRALLLPDNAEDAPGWRRWLDTHNCEDLPIFNMPIFGNES